MRHIQQIVLFISCPKDIQEELNSIHLCVDEINKTTGQQNGYSIAIISWSTDTYSQAGEDAQDVVNNQLDTKYDILIGLMWQNIGTPTKREKSGTIEEINRAIQNHKEFLIYFKTKPPENLNSLDLDQLSKVYEFKQDLSKRGILYKEFNENFGSLFRINITHLIRDKLLQKTLPDSSELSSERYASVKNLITEVEQKQDIQSLEINVFELIENSLSSLNSITISLGSMTNSVDDLTKKMNKRTGELKAFNSIKDDRLRMAKIEIVMNLFAGELDEFNTRINFELPNFSEHFLQVGPTYSQVLQYGRSNQIPEFSELKESILRFRNSIEGSLQSGASFLRSITNWPLSTPKFNKSKRETEIALKNVTKEMLEGLVLLDEALQL